ncbi:MAG: hypothetical protein C0412_20955 [Flavobacterium sp.]|nr:hypothetical protein [Flavobacterium sp.]
MKVMHTVEEVVDLINQGQVLILAGATEVLRQLPKGKWIGGSIPYFIGEEGGIFSRSKIYVSNLTEYVKHLKLKVYNKGNIEKVNGDAYENGFSVILIPGSSATHLHFAVNAPSFDGFGYKPLIGWITGVELGRVGSEAPVVVSGDDLVCLEDGAVVMHVDVKGEYFAGVDIINVFEPDLGSAQLEFLEDGFVAKDVIVEGKRWNFAEYIRTSGLDTSVPILGSYNGTNINISFQSVGSEEVKFFAPVFRNIKYRLAKPVGDYVTQLRKESEGKHISVLSFNCIINYLNGDLDGKNCGSLTAPCTFGEIAYQLLNQTLVRLIIEKRN